MRIGRISACALELPFRDGRDTCSGGRSATGFESTVIRIDTDEGQTGWDEMAPHLIGVGPYQVVAVNFR